MMDDQIQKDYNTTVKEHVTVDNDIQNVTNNSSGKCTDSVHDIQLEIKYRLLVLYLTICLCVVGSTLVVLWMFCNRRLSTRSRHFSRVNSFILNLTLADVFVILLAVLPQLIWEYVEREWVAGDFMCRVVKFLQIFALVSSNYMLVVIALDRHQAIRSPLKEPIAIWKLAGAGWVLAGLVSLPVLGIFHTNVVDGKTMCENIFRNLPFSHRQIWITWNFIVVFIIPLVLLIVCYTRIFLKIWRKSRRNSCNYNGKEIFIQSTQTNALPKAKMKTLKMTFVIVLTFIICTMPYFIVEMIMSFGDHCSISKKLYALLGGMAACNSATNPYVFLIFNVKFERLKQLCRAGIRGKGINRYRQSYYSNTIKANSQSDEKRTKKRIYSRQDTITSDDECNV